MKYFLVLFFAQSLIYAQNIFAAEVLTNCFADNSAQFFVSDLEGISQKNEAPVLLLNDKNEIVGVLSVTPARDEKYPHTAKEVNVNKLSLCSSLEVSDFFYTEGKAADVLKWASTKTIEITQDEGQIVMSTKLVHKNEYASFYKASFMIYDVFNEDTESQKGQPDYLEDWGIPKGRGEFFFYLPANWIKK